MTSNGFLLIPNRCKIKISVVSSAWKPDAKRRGFIVSYWSYRSQVTETYESKCVQRMPLHQSATCHTRCFFSYAGTTTDVLRRHHTVPYTDRSILAERFCDIRDGEHRSVPRTVRHQDEHRKTLFP